MCTEGSNSHSLQTQPSLNTGEKFDKPVWPWNPELLMQIQDNIISIVSFNGMLVNKDFTSKLAR